MDRERRLDSIHDRITQSLECASPNVNKICLKQACDKKGRRLTSYQAEESREKILGGFSVYNAAGFGVVVPLSCCMKLESDLNNCVV
jgi:hypothetical protein